MESWSQRTVEERKRRERKTWRIALAVSVLLHLLVLLLWRDPLPPPSPFAAAGPRAGDDLAAEGSMQAMNVRTPPTVPIVPPPVPVPTLDPIEPVEFDEELEVDPAQIAGEVPGALEAPGVADGEGRGDGGTADQGRFRLVPPHPRGMIIPPSNEKLKGKSVAIWVFVDERGRVVPDSTRLIPPTSDRSFNRQLVEEAAQWLFRPAEKEGRPVASWFDYEISM